MHLFQTLQATNAFLFSLFWQAAQNSFFFRILAILCSEYLPYLFVLILAIQLLLDQNKKSRLQKFLFLSFIAILSRGFFTEIIRFIIPIQRPFLALHLTPLISPDMSPGFPSGHAVFFFALAIGLILLRVRGQWLYFLAAVLIGLGRIFVGLHWPADISSGFIVALISSFITARLFKVPILRSSKAAHGEVESQKA